MTGDELQGTMGRVQTSRLPLRAHRRETSGYEAVKLVHEEPESTNPISPVIDCCYAKLCHHPVNLSTKMSALLETTSKQKT